METSKVGKRGAIVVPARLRRKFGIEEGGLVIAEERYEGILIRPAVALPVEIYSLNAKRSFCSSTPSMRKIAKQPLWKQGNWGSIPPPCVPPNPVNHRGLEGGPDLS